MIKYIESLRLSSKIYFLLIICLAGCDFLKMKEGKLSEDEQEPVARVHDNYLYESDIEGIITQGVNKSDSASIIERYVKSWIKKQLLIAEAASNIEFDESEIERKILDYRYALIIHKFEEFYINKELDKEVTEGQIEQYYRDNIENFELKQNIIRGIFIKVPKEAPKLDKAKKLLRSNKKKDKAELRSYCFRFATSYSLEDSVWLNFDEVIKNTPLMDIPNKVQFLKENQYVETSDKEYEYFMKIEDYKITDQISPLQFVKDQIVNIIINKRKLDLANQLEEDIFKEAQNNNDFEIYKEN